MTDAIGAECVAVFRVVSGMANDPEFAAIPVAEVLDAPIDRFDIDSLTFMEFVMGVEEAFGVELDEQQINACNSLGDVAALVRRAKG